MRRYGGRNLLDLIVGRAQRPWRRLMLQAVDGHATGRSVVRQSETVAERQPRLLVGRLMLCWATTISNLAISVG